MLPSKVHSCKGPLELPTLSFWKGQKQKV